MKPEYMPRTLNQKLGYLVEECGEVLAAVGKTQRWDLDSVNPELPKHQRRTNAALYSATRPEDSACYDDAADELERLAKSLADAERRRFNLQSMRDNLSFELRAARQRSAKETQT